MYITFFLIIFCLLLYVIIGKEKHNYINERELFSFFETNPYQKDIVISAYSKNIFNILDLLLRNNSNITLYFQKTFFDNLYNADLLFLHFLLEKYENNFHIIVSKHDYIPGFIYSVSNDFYILNYHQKYIFEQHMDFSTLNNFKYKENYIKSDFISINKENIIKN